MEKLRQPQQKRSIEKKNKIIEAGLFMFTTQGYYKTNTVEIAKHAGVSAGIVYNYFKDKKDIFMAALELYFNQVFMPVFEKINSLSPPLDLAGIIDEMIDVFVSSHRATTVSHQEMISMSHIDPDVHKCFMEMEGRIVEIFIAKLNELSILPDNAAEKVRLAYIMIESYCHEYTYNPLSYIDYKKLKAEVIRTVTYMFSGR